MLNNSLKTINKTKQTKITQYFKKEKEDKDLILINENFKERMEEKLFKTANDLLYENNYWCRC